MILKPAVDEVHFPAGGSRNQCSSQSYAERGLELFDDSSPVKE